MNKFTTIRNKIVERMKEVKTSGGYSLTVVTVTDRDFDEEDVFEYYPQSKFPLVQVEMIEDEDAPATPVGNRTFEVRIPTELIGRRYLSDTEAKSWNDYAEMFAADLIKAVFDDEWFDRMATEGTDLLSAINRNFDREKRRLTVKVRVAPGFMFSETSP